MMDVVLYVPTTLWEEFTIGFLDLKHSLLVLIFSLHTCLCQCLCIWFSFQFQLFCSIKEKWKPQQFTTWLFLWSLSRMNGTKSILCPAPKIVPSPWSKLRIWQLSMRTLCTPCQSWKISQSLCHLDYRNYQLIDVKGKIEERQQGHCICLQWWGNKSGLSSAHICWVNPSRVCCFPSLFPFSRSSFMYPPVLVMVPEWAVFNF